MTDILIKSIYDPTINVITVTRCSSTCMSVALCPYFGINGNASARYYNVCFQQNLIFEYYNLYFALSVK